MIALVLVELAIASIVGSVLIVIGALGPAGIGDYSAWVHDECPGSRPLPWLNYASVVAIGLAALGGARLGGVVGGLAAGWGMACAIPVAVTAWSIREYRRCAGRR